MKFVLVTSCKLYKNFDKFLNEMQSFYIYIFFYFYFNIIFVPQKVNSTSTVKSLSSWSSLSSKKFLTSTKSPKTSEIMKFEMLTWRDATEKEYTYHIAILNKNDKNFYRFCCSGALISASYVVTSAFCVNNVTRSIEFALVGKQELRAIKRTDVYGIKSIIYFKEYLEGDKEFDLCVLQLKGRVNFTSHLQPIPLVDTEPVSGTECTITTWIVMSTHSADNKLISKTVVLSGRCDEQSYRSKRHIICLHIPGRNNCSSDYASVLVCNGVLTGIGIEGSGNCKNHALFSSIFYFRSWLDDLVKGDTDKTFLTTLSFITSPVIPGRHEFSVYPERDEPHFNPKKDESVYPERDEPHFNPKRDESVYPERDEPHFNPKRDEPHFNPKRDESVYPEGDDYRSSLGLSVEFKLDGVYLFFFLVLHG